MVIQEDINWSELEGFEWDEGNREKNKIKHGVEQKECEELFYDPNIVIFDDNVHSEKELRYGAVGKTKGGRYLIIFFTIRNNRIRIISARIQSKKERMLYKEGFIDEHSK